MEVFSINKTLKKNWQAYLFTAPFVVLSAVFMVYPIFGGFVNSLYNSKWGSDVFVGFANYAKIFSKDIYLLSIRNSLFLVATVVPLLIIFGLLIAGSIFDKVPAYVSGVRICLYIPVIISMVVMSIIWRFILDSQTGLIRYFTMQLGLESVDVLSNIKWTLILLVFILFTMNIGQCVLLYVADMIGISKELIEACRIDGGSRWHMFRYILIPLTKPTTVFVFITQASATLKTFIVIQLLTKGGPNFKTTTMMFLLYQEAFENSNTGVASAIGVLMFLISLLLVTFRFISLRREENKAK